MTNIKTKQVKEVLYAYMDVEKDLSQPKILIHILKELINQLGYTHLYVDGGHGLGVVNIRDIMSVIEELEKL
jgi:hypothetical protein